MDSRHSLGEAPVAGSGSPVGAATALAPVSLAEILDRHVALTWPEAVALVAEVCHLVVQAAPTATQVPEPRRLLVYPEGSIRVESWDPKMDLESTVRMLHELLAGSETPTPLRLFVGHSISAGPFSYVSELGEALAYYERPGRPELIQAAFQRYLLTPADTPAPDPEPIDQAVPQATPLQAPRRSKSFGRLAAAAVFLVVFAGGVMLALRVVAANPASGSPATLGSVSERASTEFGQLKETLRSFGLPIADEAGVAATPEPEETVAADVPVRRPAVRRAGTPRTSPSAAPSDVREVAPGPTPEEVVSRVVSMSATAPASDEAMDADDVYTNDSTGVIPPVVVDRRVLPANMSTAGPQTANRMELLIGLDGRVEQVRLISQLQRMPDMMLLSGAKNWIFRPAMKDGHPVRYRLPITWAVSPR